MSTTNDRNPGKTCIYTTPDLSIALKATTFKTKLQTKYNDR